MRPDGRFSGDASSVVPLGQITRTIVRDLEPEPTHEFRVEFVTPVGTKKWFLVYASYADDAVKEGRRLLGRNCDRWSLKSCLKLQLVAEKKSATAQKISLARPIESM